MKILYTSVVNIGTEKGSSVHFLNLAHALQSRGQEVVVVARGRPAHGSANGLKVHSVPKIKAPKATTLLSDLLLGLTIVRLTISTRFDVLYHRDVPLANRWARTLGIPSIVEVNGIYVDELRAAGMNELGLRLYRYREMQVVRGARRIICVTAGIRDQLVSHYGVHHDQCVVVPNATDTELFRPQPKLECQQQVGLKPEDYNIGFVGAFKPWIDFERLLTATKCLHDQDIPVRFTLVGDGLKYEEVKQQIKQCGLTESIQLIGRVPHRMVPRWIGAFDVCVAPSAGTYVQRIGKSSMKLFEYMACARPVVATALPNIIETIEAAQAGLLYDVGDTNMLTQHLLSLYHDVSLREAMGVRGREYVVKHHSWDRVAERIEAIMLELLDQTEMTSAQIGVGGLKLNAEVVIQQLRKNTDFTIVHQPSLRGKVPPWTLLKRIWQYAGQVDLYYGIAYGQWPRYLFAHLRGKGTVCHWAGTDVLLVLRNPLHRWWFRAIIDRCIDRHLVVSESLGTELATLGVKTQHIPLISDMARGCVQPLPEQLAVLAYLPTKRSHFYGAPIVYKVAKRNPQWKVYIVGRGPTPQGKALPNVYELGAGIDMSKIYPQISVLVRPTVHDGLPRMVLEALTWGRYVVFSQPFPHCLPGRSVKEVEQALRELTKRDEPNWAGAAYVRETYAEDRIASLLAKVFSDVIREKRLV